VSVEQENIRARDLVTADLWPTCPKCGDLNEPHHLWCTGCGCGLYKRRMRWLSTRSTDLSPTVRAEASSVG